MASNDKWHPTASTLPLLSSQQKKTKHAGQNGIPECNPGSSSTKNLIKITQKKIHTKAITSNFVMYESKNLYSDWTVGRPPASLYGMIMSRWMENKNFLSRFTYRNAPRSSRRSSRSLEGPLVGVVSY